MYFERIYLLITKFCVNKNISHYLPRVASIFCLYYKSIVYGFFICWSKLRISDIIQNNTIKVRFPADF
ncbi:hypothetical protein C0J52_00989 [Blattella germanica]|nr:hypothetical protein C0J52_00989 [Blattella germanica]